MLLNRFQPLAAEVPVDAIDEFVSAQHARRLDDGAQQPVAGQRLALGLARRGALCLQPQRRLAPRVHRRLREAAPPGLILEADDPIRVGRGQADQPIAPFFSSHTAGRGW